MYYIKRTFPNYLLYKKDTTDLCYIFKQMVLDQLAYIGGILGFDIHKIEIHGNHLMDKANKIKIFEIYESKNYEMNYFQYNAKQNVWLITRFLDWPPNSGIVKPSLIAQDSRGANTFVIYWDPQKSF